MIPKSNDQSTAIDKNNKTAIKSPEEGREDAWLEVSGRRYRLGEQINARSFHRANLASEHQDATGLRVWTECSRILLEFLETLPAIQGRVLELGCGVGAVSSILTELGLTVTATDGSPDVVALAQKNSNGRYPVRRLVWGDQLDETFDVVIGVELMYYQTPVDKLVETMDAVLTEKGVAFFCHIIRNADIPQRFLTACHQRDLRVFDVPDIADGLVSNVKLYVVHRVSSSSSPRIILATTTPIRPLEESLRLEALEEAPGSDAEARAILAVGGI